MKLKLTAVLLFGRLMASGAEGTTTPQKAQKQNPAQTFRIPAAIPGDPSAKLDAGHLRVKLNGADAALVRLKGPGDDLVILLVFDVTGDLALVDPAKQAIFERLNSLPPNVYVGVLRASDGLHVSADPSPDRAAIASTIANLTVSAKSALLDTVAGAATLADAMAQRSGVRTAVLYVTDSDVGNYREDYTNPVINWSDSRDLSRRFPEGLIREKTTKLEETLAAAQSPVYFVHLEYRTDRLNEAYQSGLLRIAAATGGTGVFSRSATEVTESVNKAIDAVLGEYILWVQLPAKTPRSATVELQSGTRTLVYPPRRVFRNGN